MAQRMITRPLEWARYGVLVVLVFLIKRGLFGRAALLAYGFSAVELTRPS
jgi:hypothetical protein